MRVSLNWLKDYVDFTADADALAHQLTMLGLEIEWIERNGAEISNVVVGRILSIEPHPNADKLVVCRTDVGRGEALQIVCGAKNMKEGDVVPTAILGAALPGGFTIERRKMRGIESQGMMCSKRELGLGDDHQGLYILSPDLPIGADVKPLLGLDDTVFEVSITPNRGDWACMIGVAREIAAKNGVPLRIPDLHVPEGDRPAEDYAAVNIEAPDLCPRYIGRVLHGVKIGPSPEWLQQRLIAAGQRPISNIVDITNYVMLETGQPLHAFDHDKLNERRIVVRTARPGETLETIDGQPRRLTEEMLVIADASRAVALAGIMGGSNSEVGEGTVNILLESAYFNPVSIRRTSRALGLQTEASARFQRGIDPEMTLYAANRAAALMTQLAGGTIAAGAIDVYPKPVMRPAVSLRFARANTLLGTEFDPQRQIQRLRSLGFALISETSDACTVQVPSWRPDVSLEVDLIEEVARLDGYDDIPMSLPKVHPVDAVLAPENRPLKDIKHLLVSLGLTEMLHWSFGAPDEAVKTGLHDRYAQMVLLQNPLSENHAAMRTTLLPALLASIAANINHGAPDIAAFELGCVYQDLPGEPLPTQSHHLAVALCGKYMAKHWSLPERTVDFYDIKGIFESIADYFGLEYALEPIDAMPLMNPGASAGIRRLSDNTPLGCIGAVSAQVLKNYDIHQDVFILQLELDPLLVAPKPVATFRPLPKFPPSLRDLAVVVDAHTPAAELRAAALKAGGELLKRVDIFDVYTGKPIPNGKKSVALSLAFQSEDRTLTDADTNASMEAILVDLTKRFEAILR